MEYHLTIKNEVHANIDEAWKRYTKWKKAVTKDHILYDWMYMKFSE